MQVADRGVSLVEGSQGVLPVLVSTRKFSINVWGHQ